MTIYVSGLLFFPSMYVKSSYLHGFPFYVRGRMDNVIKEGPRNFGDKTTACHPTSLVTCVIKSIILLTLPRPTL